EGFELYHVKVDGVEDRSIRFRSSWENGLEDHGGPPGGSSTWTISCPSSVMASTDEIPK
ncbi:hypothetical protein L9F63_017595, partial [Diploptera punctata]